MVPGMTERERLAADVRRLEWLAETRLGPTRIAPAPSRSRDDKSRFAPRFGLLRQRIVLVILVVRQVRWLEPRIFSSLGRIEKPLSR